VRAAEILGISLKTLYNRLGEYREAGTAPASGAEVAARETDRAEAQRS
jgi:transposase